MDWRGKIWLALAKVRPMGSNYNKYLGHLSQRHVMNIHQESLENHAHCMPGIEATPHESWYVPCSCVCKCVWDTTAISLRLAIHRMMCRAKKTDLFLWSSHMVSLKSINIYGKHWQVLPFLMIFYRVILHRPHWLVLISMLLNFHTYHFQH